MSVSKHSSDKNELCRHEFVYPRYTNVNSNSNTPLVNYCYCIQCGVVSVVTYCKFEMKTFVKPCYVGSQICVDPLKIAYNIKKESNSKHLTYTPWYLKERSKIISYLKLLTLKYKISDSSFFKTLYYIDLTFRDKSHCFNLIESLDYYIAAMLFLIAKFNEDNYNEPSFHNVINSSCNGILDMNMLIKYEVKCLQMLNYNLVEYTLYDWICLFFYNGFVFQDELHNNNNNVSISSIYTYIKRIIALITYKVVMLQYTPLVLCLSILKLTRDEFKLEEDNFNVILKLYNCVKVDIDSCVKAIRTIIILKQREISGSVDEYKECSKTKVKHDSPSCVKIPQLNMKSQFYNYANSSKLPKKNVSYLRITNNISTSNIRDIPKYQEHNNIHLHKNKLQLKALNISNNSNSFIKPSLSNISYIQLNTQPNQTRNDSNSNNNKSDITPNVNRANKTLSKINLTKKNKNYFLIKNASSIQNTKHEHDTQLTDNTNNKWSYLRNENSFISKHFGKRNIIALNYITNTTTSFLTKNESLPKKPPLYNKPKTTKKLKLKSLHTQTNDNNIDNLTYEKQDSSTTVLSNIKLKPIITLRSKLPTLSKFISKSKKS